MDDDNNRNKSDSVLNAIYSAKLVAELSMEPSRELSMVLTKLDEAEMWALRVLST